MYCNHIGRQNVTIGEYEVMILSNKPALFDNDNFFC